MSVASSARPSLHPALWVAAVAATLASLAAVGAIFGIIPVGQAEPSAADAPLALASAPAVTTNPAPAAAAPNPQPVQANPARPAPRQEPAPVRAEPRRAEPRKPANHSVAQDDGRSSARAPVAVARCLDCGTVQSISVIEQEGEAAGIGAVGGAVVGGVLGHQVGEGNGKRLARIGGAVLGGLAGHQAEKKLRSQKQWDVTVRMEDGSTRHVLLDTEPTWQNGDPVRVQDGRIEARSGAVL